jgi:hypothetical protein
MKSFYEKNKAIIHKVLTIILGLILVAVVSEILILGVSKFQMIAYQLLLVLVWLCTSALGSYAYSSWFFTKNIIEGADSKLSAEERFHLMRVHSAIILGAAILVSITAFINTNIAAVID